MPATPAAQPYGAPIYRPSKDEKSIADTVDRYNRTAVLGVNGEGYLLPAERDRRVH